MGGVAANHNQGPFFLALVVVVHDSGSGDQGAFGGNGFVKNQLLLTVQDAGQVYAGGDRRLGKQVENHGDGKAGNDLEVLFEAVVQFGKPRPDAQGIEHHIFPGVGPLHGANDLADRIHVESHDLLLAEFLVLA